jgi:hypothetical protein
MEAGATFRFTDGLFESGLFLWKSAIMACTAKFASGGERKPVRKEPETPKSIYQAPGKFLDYCGRSIYVRRTERLRK